MDTPDSASLGFLAIPPIPVCALAALLFGGGIRPEACWSVSVYSSDSMVCARLMVLTRAAFSAGGRDERPCGLQTRSANRLSTRCAPAWKKIFWLTEVSL